jgi:predicted transcriptional regulator
MQSKIVKDMMIPLADYATVHQNATLHEAVQALKEAQDKFNQNLYQHRAVLVYNDKNQIVGKLSQLDLLRSLEPKYKSLEELDKLALLHIDVDYIRNMMEEYGLWQKPINDICRKASTTKVKNIMHKPAKGEFIEESESINTAIHQLVVGQQQSLLVTRGKDIVGILRLTDVFNQVCNLIDACEI